MAAPARVPTVIPSAARTPVSSVIGFTTCLFRSMGTSFFVVPAGLADGLALKKLRYGSTDPIRPRQPDGRQWVPRSDTLGGGFGVWMNRDSLTSAGLGQATYWL